MYIGSITKYPSVPAFCEGFKGAKAKINLVKIEKPYSHADGSDYLTNAKREAKTLDKTREMNVSIYHLHPFVSLLIKNRFYTLSTIHNASI